VTTLDHVVELNDLLHELLLDLQVLFDQHFACALLEVSIAGRRQFHIGEQVSDDALKQGDVFGEELRQIHILNAFKDEQLLGLLG